MSYWLLRDCKTPKYLRRSYHLVRGAILPPLLDVIEDVRIIALFIKRMIMAYSRFKFAVEVPNLPPKTVVFVALLRLDMKSI